MSKMRVIDLLNMISKGEEVPKKIKWENFVWEYDDSSSKNYVFDYGDLFTSISGSNLNDEIEIPEDVVFENIEEMIKLNNVSGSSDLIALSQMQWENNCRIEKKINELIRNQKKIISKLEDIENDRV